MIDSIFRVIVKVQMFFAVRAARKQARKDIAIEESFEDSNLYISIENPWEASFDEDFQEALELIDNRMSERKELEATPLPDFAGYKVEIDSFLDFHLPNMEMATVSWDTKDNSCANVVKVNSFLARQENNRTYRAILWHEVGHIEDPAFNINRYLEDLSYHAECEIKADLNACKKGYAKEMLAFLTGDKLEKIMDAQEKAVVSMRVLAITSFLSREKETK